MQFLVVDLFTALGETVSCQPKQSLYAIPSLSVQLPSLFGHPIVSSNASMRKTETGSRDITMSPAPDEAPFMA